MCVHALTLRIQFLIHILFPHQIKDWLSPVHPAHPPVLRPAARRHPAIKVSPCVGITSGRTLHLNSNQVLQTYLRFKGTTLGQRQKHRVFLTTLLHGLRYLQTPLPLLLSRPPDQVIIDLGRSLMKRTSPTWTACWSPQILVVASIAFWTAPILSVPSRWVLRAR